MEDQHGGIPSHNWLTEQSRALTEAIMRLKHGAQINHLINQALKDAQIVSTILAEMSGLIFDHTAIRNSIEGLKATARDLELSVLPRRDKLAAECAELEAQKARLIEWKSQFLQDLASLDDALGAKEEPQHGN
jgi:hypothetical protein